jgi:hypothetical protein
MNRARVAGFTVGALAAGAVTAIVINRRHHGKPPPELEDEVTELAEANYAIAELEDRISRSQTEPEHDESTSKLETLMRRLAPEGVEYEGGFSFVHIVLMRLEALRRGKLSPPAADALEANLIDLADGADQEGL